MLNQLAALFGTALRLDVSAGPPYTLTIWNPETASWEPVGATSAAGRRSGGGPLALTSRQSSTLDWGYLVTTAGLAVLRGDGAPIATHWPRVVAQPELVLTAAGEIIGA